MHREFAKLETATEALFQSNETRPHQLLSKINDLHRRSNSYFSHKNESDYKLTKQVIEELEAILHRFDPNNLETRTTLEEIARTIEQWHNVNDRTMEASAELRETNNRLNFSLESSAQSLVSAIQEQRAWKLLEMERSLDKLSIKATIGGIVIFAGLMWQIALYYKRRIQPLKLQVQEQELQMQAQEKLMSLALLASGVAHEIRSPLAAMKARLFTLKKVLAQNESAIEDHQAISLEIGRMEKIVKSFLQLARPADPEFEIVDTRLLIVDLVTERAKEYQSSGILLKATQLAKAPVWADRDQLRQVLSNLIQNAKDAIPERGEIVVRSEETILQTSKSSISAVRIDVADTGPGIPASLQNRLFDPFFTTKKSGTGLGLPLSQVLIGKQGGRIAFKSQEGKGTCFSIFIPTAPESTAQL